MYSASRQKETPAVAIITGMSHLRQFPTLMSALCAGYQVQTVTPHGYIVRIKTNAGWSRAVVHSTIV